MFIYNNLFQLYCHYFFRFGNDYRLPIIMNNNMTA